MSGIENVSEALIRRKLRQAIRELEVFRPGVVSHIEPPAEPGGLYMATVNGRPMPYIDPTISVGDIVKYVDQPDPFAWARFDPLAFEDVSLQTYGSTANLFTPRTSTPVGPLGLIRPRTTGSFGALPAGTPGLILHTGALSNGGMTFDSEYDDNVIYSNENTISLAWAFADLLPTTPAVEYTVFYSTTVNTSRVSGMGFFPLDTVLEVQTTELLTGTGPWSFPEVTAPVDNTVVLYLSMKVNDGVSGSYVTVPGTPIAFPSFSGLGGFSTWWEELDQGQTSDGQLQVSASSSVRLSTFACGLVA